MKKFQQLVLLALFAFIFGAGGAYAVMSTNDGFYDVSHDSWYGDSVYRFYELGIFEGYGDGSFQPNASVSRAELAVVLDRLLENLGPDLANGGVCFANDTIYFDGEGYSDGCNDYFCDGGTFGGTEVACEGLDGEPFNYVITNSWEE